MLPESIFIRLLSSGKPDAIAYIEGSASAPGLWGQIKFYDSPFDGVLIEAQLFQLPAEDAFFAMHIHESGDCTPPFDHTGNHYNPTNVIHPLHAGDLTPILSNQGFAYSVMFTQRFTLDEILNRSVIIHSNPDNFTSQPSGNPGAKIGCGTILPFTISNTSRMV